MDKWCIHKWRCRQNYRDGCRPVWMVTPPGEDNWFSHEFDTWAEAVAFVNDQLTDISATLSAKEHHADLLHSDG